MRSAITCTVWVQFVGSHRLSAWTRSLYYIVISLGPPKHTGAHELSLLKAHTHPCIAKLFTRPLP